MKRSRNVIDITIVFACLLTVWTLLFFHGSVRREFTHSDDSRNKFTRDRLTRLVSPEITTAKPNVGLADCSTSIRYCTSHEDCDVLCRSYRALNHRCDASSHICAPSMTDVRVPNDDSFVDAPTVENCDLKNGEYAVLTGYTDLGIALWRCVQLYKQFDHGSDVNFCEGGVFDMDARLRSPSYRDCECPVGTVRAITKSSRYYDAQLPHCVPTDAISFYRDDMIVV